MPERRLAELLEDAAEFFASNWDTQSSQAARDLLARHGLDDKVIRRFGVGFAPVGSDDLMDHLHSLGYSTEEIVASGLGRQSARGHVHPHFSSRIMFPIREPDGRIVGFAGMGTHLAPSWPLWVISPDTDLYNRSEAVFGLDQAAKKIATRKSAVIVGDCIEVLKAHQDGRPHAVTVHTSGVTEEQVAEVGSVVSGGPDALEIEFDGIRMESDADRSVLADRAPQVPAPREPPPHLPAKRLALIIGTALVAINTFTGAPLLAVWIGAQAQAGQVLSLRGVITVIVVLTVLEFLLGLALTWLSSTYDRLTGRPRFAGETSPWQRAKRGDRVQDIRARFGMSPPEKIVAASVIIGVFALEIWFFFFAGSSLPNQ